MGLSPFAAFPQPKLKDEDCLNCHSDQTLSHDVGGKSASLFVDAGKLKHSVHGQMFSCVDCHADVKSAVHETPPKKITCEQCHAEAQAAYAHSTHAQASRAGKDPAAACVDCHAGPHEIVAASDATSPVNHANIPATCGRCHGQKFLMESNGHSAQPFLSYQESVHGRAVEKGSAKAAVCTDCHGSHQIIPANQAQSSIYKFNVPATCGKCHSEIAQKFAGSIHGQALARGNSQTPVCTDCHGIHSILSHKNPNSPVAEQNISQDTCAPCHEGVRLSREFGVPGGRVTSYMDSYHGLANKAGSVVAANCSSCHGVHDILPSNDPRSSVSHANLDATCGKCHKGVTNKFTLTKVHLQDGGGFGPPSGGDIDAMAVHWVRVIYIALIALVIGAMVFHNLIIWRRKLADRRASHAVVVTRMTVNQRWQHLILFTSFFALVITGFALKFPDSAYAHVLGLSEHLRSLIHRIAGVALIAVGGYHVIYVMASRQGRMLLRDIAPVPRDVSHAVGAMLYYLGLRARKPQFTRFSYAEKAEYWALVWGTALMGVTGVMLWAKVWVGNLLARWWVDVATAIHYYEAILATLAILVWHFYQVFLDPDVYPMNSAWLDGKMPVDLYKHEHSLDTETLTTAEHRKHSGSAAQQPKHISPKPSEGGADD